MPRTKLLRGKRESTSKTRILPARNPSTGRFLSGRPIKVLGNERGAILGNRKRRA